MSIELKQNPAQQATLPAQIQLSAAAEQALMSPDHPLRASQQHAKTWWVKQNWFKHPRLAMFRARKALLNESGAATAEYAVATMAAVAFAGLLVVIMRSDEVRGILTDLVRRALTVG